MKRKSINMENVVRKLAVCCLLLFAFAGSVAAQNDPLHVIKKGDHYLAHVYDETTHDWVLQDATSFSPNCLWHSGNTVDVLGLHHNYYFVDGNDNYRFLAAPLQADGTLSLSATLPSTQLLRNTDQVYYFYDWDPDQYGAGVARGHKYTGVDYSGCNHSWHWFDENNHSLGGECWEAYWVEFNNNNEWRLTHDSHYSRNGNDGVPNAGLYRAVSVTEHALEIISETGGADDLTVVEEMEYLNSQNLSISVSDYSYTYTPAYTTYVFEGNTHNYYDNGDQGTVIPGNATSSGNTVSSYKWTISGEGAQFLSFDHENDMQTSTETAPTLYYIHDNTSGHKWAVITVTITFTNPDDGSTSTQVRSGMVEVKTSCHNPAQSSAPVITYEYVTVSWYPTADSYIVSWKKHSEVTWTSVPVGEVQSYSIAGLEYDTEYDYKVEAVCSTPDQNPATEYSFHTYGQPGLLVYGAVFGGGRMADVGGKTEVAIINCDSIHAVYGGNDIAGTVIGGPQGAYGSSITLGVDSGDSHGYDTDYGTTDADIRIGDVYGGGNGYYAYNGTSFEPASRDYNSQSVAPNASINAMTSQNEVGEAVWTNTGTEDVTINFPSITKTAITVTNDYVKVDSIFGGAKNAFLTTNSGDGSLITVDGGTAFAVFGGNNIGGAQGYGIHHIVINDTKTSTGNDYPSRLGRDFGIGYVFGGGNKVYGSTTQIYINGGQCDTVFAGGNAADVYRANAFVNCQLGALANGAYGHIYTNAINDSYSGGNLTNEAINPAYAWNRLGIYNVRTLFGGNNRAHMESVPTLTLTSGSLGTVYGGGNEGDMLAQQETTIEAPTTYGNAPVNMVVNYSTHVQMNSSNILIDYLYGGCQKSNVDYSTLVEIQDGHVGTVYGGCNISGDVGSTRVNPNVPSDPPSEAYQAVQGGTYVKASGGVVYNNLFGGSNGFYHCNNGINYIQGVNYVENENYVGWPIPTHNETHVIVTGNALIKKNVYAGGNMSPVGFTDATVGGRTFPQFVGLASVLMDGGVVEHDVFGGGNMASIFGSNEVMVSGGTIGMSGNYDGALYGGNDRSGQAGQISNRVFPVSYNVASDGHTSLTDVNTYVSLTGKPNINTVYGGGNGDYDYAGGDDVIGPGQYCEYDENGNFDDKPIQTNTFVDINITGNRNDGNDGGHINTVYGGGNGVTVTGSITVFLNVEDPIAYDHVGTIFGGNNKDNVVETENVPLVPDIILLHGQVGTVYGGCNKGAMTTGKNFNIGGKTYYNVGSMVRLRSSYQATPNAPVVTPDAVVSNAVYGGCRMNDVYHNSLVLVEGGADVPANLFGGCDISGAVHDISYVVVTGGKVLGNIYAGGNGNYTYTDEGEVYSGTELVATGNIGDDYHEPPTSSVSRVDLLGGQVGADASHIAEVFGGGYGQLTNTTGDVIVNVGPATASSWDGLPLIYGNVYGGSAFGNVNTNSDNTTTVNFLNGTLHGNLFGGGLGRKATEGGVTAIEAKVFGKVFVNISNDDQTADNCFIDLRDADIYGCNNQNGSPQDDVRVDVWKTAFNFNDYQSGDKYTASYIESDADYAIDEVFGGGNQADYAPAGGENSTKKTMVYIHDCLNTIRRVFSGGNAAAAVGVVNTIEGGRMDYVFGGGNGEVTEANVGNGGTHLVVKGGTITHLFGGSNKTGNIAGPMYTEVNGDSQCNEEMDMHITDFFGGSNEAQLISDNVYSIIKCGAVIDNAYGGSNLANITGNVIFDVRGGTINNVFGGSKGVLNGTAANIDGNVTLNLEGGEITNAFGGSDQNGNITGNITVNVIDYELEDCGLDLTNVYGGGNLTAYTPTTTTVGPIVNVMHIAQEPGIRGNVFGGGNLAAVNANAIVNIGYDATAMSRYLPHDFATSGLNSDEFRAFVTGNVFGGGNEAGVGNAENACNTTVVMYDGTVMTGIYGGCNTSGTVAGNTLVELVGGTVGSANSRAGIFGGGYGQNTAVSGDVHVIFGDDTNVENEYPILYGDLYGGSALGNVNTDNTNTTTVDVLNGIITGTGSGSSYVYGNIFGGGLGRKAAEGVSAVEAKVFGQVQVNIGAPRASEQDEPRGKATLVDCNVYGCNNQNGSPQDVARVDVYQSAHTDGTNGTPDNTVNGDAFAIHQVFGGGKEADYIQGKRTYVHIHYCENTIERLFGGGDASDVWGVELWFDGGRYAEVFGGGNGEVTAANITSDGITIHKGGGLIGSYFDGGNMLGHVTGTVESSDYDGGCGAMVTTDYFLGGNNHTIYGDLEIIISCGDAHNWKYKNFYGGTRLAQVYGNIHVTIRGGIFENVYGGSKGSAALAANINDYTPEYIAEHPDLHEGDGGNITLNIYGGTIGNLFGGCDVNGSPIGKITINVKEDEEDCPLYIGNIYGGGNNTDYTPTYNQYLPTNPNALSTPEINILKAHVGGDVPVDADDHPLLPVINPNYQLPANEYEGNVFGGGNMGDVTANPKVKLGDPEHPTTSPVTIEGNVYGGGKIGKINGSTNVIIVPTE